MKLKIICVILARSGSKGLRNKNIKLLNGKPLISYPIIFAKKFREISNIVLSTDSKKIAKIGEKFGAMVPFIRPKKISGDFATTESCLKHALLTTEKKLKTKYDYCIFLTATDIFRKTKWLKTGIRIMKNNKKIESVFPAYVTHKNFWIKKNRKFKRVFPWMKIYKSRQVRQKLYREDTGLSCISKASLWRLGKRIGDNVHIIENTDSFSGLDIHTLEDLKLVSAALKIRNEK